MDNITQLTPEDKIKDHIQGRFAVYIDASNLEGSVSGMFVKERDIPKALQQHSIDALCFTVDYKQLFEFLRIFQDLIKYFIMLQDTKARDIENLDIF